MVWSSIHIIKLLYDTSFKNILHHNFLVEKHKEKTKAEW
jgi:hypothetical protein